MGAGQQPSGKGSGNYGGGEEESEKRANRALSQHEVAWQSWQTRKLDS